MEHQFGPWSLKCSPNDGARLEYLRFAGRDLLTTRPVKFAAPAKDLGIYETRPVFGYDDCLPTVSPSPMPGDLGLSLPDHGELWQMPWKVSWKVSEGAAALECCVDSKLQPGLSLRRRLVFARKTLQWQFELSNASRTALPAMHMMHALMPPSQIVGLTLPECSCIVDENTWQALPTATAAQAAKMLLGVPKGRAEMWLLRGVNQGRVDVRFRDGLDISIRYPLGLFPTLAIWWNRMGYPDEPGIQRDECAFEPCPGTCSSLDLSHRQGACMMVPSRGKLAWTIEWRLNG